MWSSNVYDDLTTYEGLTREGAPHGRGVMHIGNWTAGGFQHPKPGDRCPSTLSGTCAELVISEAAVTWASRSVK